MDEELPHMSLEETFALVGAVGSPAPSRKSSATDSDRLTPSTI